jgi:hypothetical protein
MCDCSGDDEAEPAEIAFPLPALMDRTRAVEARMAGERVPCDLWPVFFGLASGSLPWRHHARMLESRRLAMAFLAMGTAARRRSRRRAKMRCTDPRLDGPALRAR